MRILTLLFCLILSSNVLAIENINISRGHTDPIPIALNPFLSDKHAEHKMAQDMITVIASDLGNSGLFKLIPKAAFIDTRKGVSNQPLFPAWRQIGATILINGEVKMVSPGIFEVSFVVWDAVSEHRMSAEIFTAPQKMWRRIAHKISDNIYQKVTGEKGYFDTQIAYVSETGNAKRKTKRLAIMDYDGANAKHLTDGKNLVLTPRFSPDAQQILYLSYANKRPRLHLRNIVTGADKVLGNFPGMTFAPRFSHDGKRALFSMSKNGATNIYEIDINQVRVRAITSGRFINTSPSYSADESKIVFNSDRGGSRQLYTMNNDGSNIQRISFSEGAYTSPIWSPRGDYIAFTKQIRGQGFFIGVMRADGSGERLITNGYLVEGPAWAPNGRVLTFTREQSPYHKGPKRSRIYSIDLTGFNEQELKTTQDASDPDWSALLKP